MCCHQKLQCSLVPGSTRWTLKQKLELDVEGSVQPKTLKPVAEVPEGSAGMRPMLSACDVLLKHLEFFTKF